MARLLPEGNPKGREKVQLGPRERKYQVEEERKEGEGRERGSF
jgi:hypothetical protein